MGHLSIDFRQNELRLLETDGSTKSLKVKKFRILDAVRNGADMFDDVEARKAVSDTLSRMLSKERFTRDPAGMALGSSYCMFRDVDLPFKNEDQIRKVIKFEVEGSIQMDIDDVVICFFKKMESLDKSHLMVVGAKKDGLIRQLELLQAWDVDPYFVDLDILCIFNALSATGYLQEAEKFLLLNLTSDATHILVINYGRMISGRSVPMGVGGLITALEHDLKMARMPTKGVEDLLGLTPVRDLTVHARSMEDEEVAVEGEDDTATSSISMSKEANEMAEQRRSDFLKKLRRELLRTLTFMGADEKPEKILITGAGCEMIGMKDTLKELFGVEVVELDLLSRIDHSIPDEQIPAVNRELCVPLGAAFKSAGHDVTRVDFRQEEVKYARKFDQIKMPMACLVFLFLILIVLLNLEQFMLRSSKRIDMAKITRVAEDRLKSVLDKPEDAEKIVARYEEGLQRVAGIRRAIENENKRLGDILGREGTIPELPSVFPVWHAFFDWINKHSDEFDFFRLNKLEIKMTEKNPTLTFFCNVRSGRDESLLEHGLANDVPIFTNVRAGKRDSGSDGLRVLDRWTIEIDMSLAEKEGG